MMQHPCKECKHPDCFWVGSYTGTGCDDRMPKTNDDRIRGMTGRKDTAEYIDRQSVYDVLRKAPISNMGTKLYIYDDIADIPAANVVARELYERALSDVIDLSMKRKTGKWIEVTRYGLNSQRAICECSLCHNTTWVYDDIKRRFKYCPNCGSRLLSYDV